LARDGLKRPCGCRAPPAQKLPLRAGTLVLVDPTFFELPDRALSVLRFPGASIANIAFLSGFARVRSLPARPRGILEIAAAVASNRIYRNCRSLSFHR
jgi:hypothetical protein